MNPASVDDLVLTREFAEPLVVIADILNELATSLAPLVNVYAYG